MSDPLTDEDFAALMAPLAPARHVAVAVSGGADSLALLVLTARWAAVTGRRATALTVDHGLRAEAAEEAAFVARVAEGLGLVHETLPWRGETPRGNVQAAAREARYRLLSARCAALDADLLVAHTLDDQAETFLLRLGRGSGVDGLAAMPAERALGRVRLLRPLLSVRRAALEAVVRAAGLSWIEDPSNDDRRYERVRVRQAMAGLSDLGLTPERLAGTADHLARARSALEAATRDLAGRAVRFDDAGFALIDPELVRAAPREIGLRLLADVVTAVGGRRYRPRFERLDRAFENFVAASGEAGAEKGAAPAGQTLGGCFLQFWHGRLLVGREAAAAGAALAVPVEPAAPALWDGRFMVCLDGASIGGLTAAALGREGVSAVRQRDRAAAERLALLPGPVRPSLPALWREAELWAAPVVGYAAPGIEMTALRAEFVGASSRGS